MMARYEASNETHSHIQHACPREERISSAKAAQAGHGSQQPPEATPFITMHNMCEYQTEEQLLLSRQLGQGVAHNTYLGIEEGGVRRAGGRSHLAGSMSKQKTRRLRVVGGGHFSATRKGEIEH